MKQLNFFHGTQMMLNDQQKNKFSKHTSNIQRINGLKESNIQPKFHFYHLKYGIYFCTPQRKKDQKKKV